MSIQKAQAKVCPSMLPFVFAVIVIPSFCLCFERLFLCFTQFGGSQSHCLNCHEFHDTASLSPHLTLTFHNLGPRNLKECFP